MLKGWYFCALGLGLETVIMPVDEPPDSLERAKTTGYSLHELVGKVSLVFLCSAHPALLRAGAVIAGGNNGTGFSTSGLVNTKFTSKANILPACQWLKAIWLSLGICFLKHRVIHKEGAVLGLATTAFLGCLGGPCPGLQRVGEISERSRAVLAPRAGKSYGQGPKSLRARIPEEGELVIEKILSMEVCRTHTQQNPYLTPTAELHGDDYQGADSPFCGLTHIRNKPLSLLGFISAPQP